MSFKAHYVDTRLLSEDAERELLERAGKQDAAARNELIKHFWALADSVARRTRGGSLSEDELHDAVIAGLMTALDSYDRSRKTRFSHWVKTCVRTATIDHWRGVVRSRRRVLAYQEQSTASTEEEDTYRVLEARDFLRVGRECVERWITELPANVQAVFRRRLAGESYPAMVGDLKVTKSRLGQWWAEAVAHIRTRAIQEGYELLDRH